MKLPKVSDYMDVEVHTLKADTPIDDDHDVPRGTVAAYMTSQLRAIRAGLT
jgi:hypothetical protein